MRILAIDYGIKNTGFAIGESGSTITLPYLKTSNVQTLIQNILSIIREEKIEKIILGIPEFKYNKQENIVFEFKKVLEKNTNIPIETINEYGTSKEVFDEEFKKFSNIKKIKRGIHSRSAEKILERYFLQTNEQRNL